MQRTTQHYTRRLVAVGACALLSLAAIAGYSLPKTAAYHRWWLGRAWQSATSTKKPSRIREVLEEILRISTDDDYEKDWDRYKHHRDWLLERGLASEVLRTTLATANLSTKTALAYKSVLDVVSDGVLNQLIRDENLGVAVQAAWEAAIRQEESKTARAEQFAAWLENGIGISPPRWWVSRLAETDEDLSPTPSVTCVARYGNLYIRDNSQELRFGEDVGNELHVSARPFSPLIAAVDSTFSFVSLYEVDGYPYEVFCVNNLTKMIVWRSESWSYYGPRLIWSSGSSHAHDVELIVHDNLLLVFGAGYGNTSYLEAFEKETGRVRFRFSSDYWSYRNQEDTDLLSEIRW